MRLLTSMRTSNLQNRDNNQGQVVDFTAARCYLLFNILNILRPTVYFQDIGAEVRKARLAMKLTQGVLAKRAEVSRGIINQLETGVFPGLGVKKLLSVLQVVGLDMAIHEKRVGKKREPDYLEMACISANVSYKGHLTPDALARTLLTGKVPPKLRPQLRVVYDELPPPRICRLGAPGEQLGFQARNCAATCTSRR